MHSLPVHQIEARPLYFEGRNEATKKRLQKLKAAGLVGERKRQAFEPSVLFLTRNGLTLLREHGRRKEALARGASRLARTVPQVDFNSPITRVKSLF